ncbi:MAG: hypothetical protein JEY79_18025 [Pseudodesulfovibrio sp.]|nr:hypothetical protein [Pseudodesulfovibrio sp.]
MKIKSRFAAAIVLWISQHAPVAVVREWAIHRWVNWAIRNNVHIMGIYRPVQNALRVNIVEARRYIKRHNDNLNLIGEGRPGLWKN